MKVEVKKDVFVVHFETRKHPSPKDPIVTGLPIRDLTTITCHVRKLNLETSEKVEVAHGEAGQHYNDRCNHVHGRKVAFARAISNFDKGDRTVFWNRFKKDSRYKVRDNSFLT